MALLHAKLALKEWLYPIGDMLSASVGVGLQFRAADCF